MVDESFLICSSLDGSPTGPGTSAGKVAWPVMSKPGSRLALLNVFAVDEKYSYFVESNGERSFLRIGLLALVPYNLEPIAAR